MRTMTSTRLCISRRMVLAGTAGLAGTSAWAAASPAVLRLGVLSFGSVHWVADVMTHHRLDVAHGFTLQTSVLANTEAAKVALLGRAVDVATSDWPFVAAQRARGGRLCFAAGSSSSLGGIMVPAASPVKRLADLRGLRLGVAGGAADKSWLLVQAAAQRQGIDLVRQTSLSYGAPPLLGAMQQDGRLDALLTFWNFAAKLEVAGFREAMSVAECAQALGLRSAPVLVGYVFDEDWGAAHRAVIDGFLAASAAATQLLATSPQEWARIRPLMAAPDDALFEDLRRRFIAGIGRRTAAMLEAQAGQIQSALAGAGLAAGHAALPPGVFWQTSDAG
jgi:NitT/TauT family transport system substrate-binding protein